MIGQPDCTEPTANPDRRCQHEGCPKPILARSLCRQHYDHARRSIDGFTAASQQLCAAAGCDRYARTAGWCVKHMARVLNHGTPDNPLDERDRCAIDDCGRVAVRGGLCAAHRVRTSPGQPLMFKPGPGASCQVDGCGEPWNTRGLCKPHYDRFRRTLPGFIRRAEPLCANENCDRPRTAGTLCNGCLQRELYSRRVRNDNGTGPRCVSEGCERAVLFAKMCSMHYQRHRKELRAIPRNVHPGKSGPEKL